nr:hypothetical protein [Gammaproteobacteria bacterium]
MFINEARAALGASSSGYLDGGVSLLRPIGDALLQECAQFNGWPLPVKAITRGGTPDFERGYDCGSMPSRLTDLLNNGRLGVSNMSDAGFVRSHHWSIEEPFVH